MAPEGPYLRAHPAKASRVGPQSTPCCKDASEHKRATILTTALDNGTALEGVQRDVGHADPSTTKLYERRGHNPEKSASFYANY